MGDELRGVIRAADKFEPIQNGGIVGLGVAAVFSVRPEALAGDDVLEAVAIDVHQGDGVGFGKGDTVRVGAAVGVEDQMAFELDFAVGALAGQLLIPGEAEAVWIEAGDDVGEAVAIDIINIHLGTAPGRRLRLRREGVGMKFPERVTFEGGGLLEPAGPDEDIVAAIGIDVAEAEAVEEFVVAVALCSDAMKRPLDFGVVPIRRGGVTEIVARAANQLAFAVAEEIAEGGGFVIGGGEDEMALPMAFFVLGIFVPESFLAGKTDVNNIRPAIAIDVEGEGEEVVGVFVLLAEGAFEAGDGDRFAGGVGGFEGMVGGTIFVADFEIRAFIPKGAGGDVHVAVVVEIRVVGAFAPELVGQLDFAEGWKFVLGEDGGGGREKSRAHDGIANHCNIMWTRRQRKQEEGSSAKINFRSLDFFARKAHKIV